MKFSELKTKSASELHGYLAKFREELRQARFAAFTTKPKNVRHLRALRRAIARALTLLQNSPRT